MIYRDFKGKKLSNLGVGTMRLPCIDGEIDKKATTEMIDYALKNGVNYFDTAWGYHSGNSETVVGEILSQYPRDSYYLATKFPGYDLNNFGKCEEIFNKQLEKLKTDYFDFYLIHCVDENNINYYLDDKYDTYSYLLEQKKNGRIKHLGFSVHATLETTKRFLDKWGDHIEFGQVQLNYLDYNFQNAKAKIELLKSMDIPVWVMEPIRGGKLASLEEEYLTQLNSLDAEKSAVEWAFRFLQTIPEVCVILSGMSNFEQVEDNIRIFSEDKPLSEKEFDTLLNIAHDMVKKNTVMCTSCRYCVDHCPHGIEIPKLLKLYNDKIFNTVGFEKQPSDCGGCRSCETVCPQEIKISEVMTDFAARLR